MNILHYALGLPPYRSGGLTKYSIDLMKEQARNNKVYMMFPGSKSFFRSYPSIKKYKKYSGIDVFEITNPQLVPLLGGISDVSEATKKCDINIFVTFLKDNNIEILHIHTLMGLYVELLKAAKYLGIKVVFTTHDYFGLAPNPNFLDVDNNLRVSRSYEDFKLLNINPSSSNKVMLLQSRLYRFVKDKGIIEKLKVYLEKNKNIDDNKSQNQLGELTYNDFIILRSYYDDIFSLIDIFLFNSKMTKELYDQFLKIKNYKLAPITHSKIIDKRKVKIFDNELKITYMGGAKAYKGYNIILDIAKSLEDLDIKFNFYGIQKESNFKNINYFGNYSYDDLEKIFNDTDLLVVPSLCKETFAFIVAEAYSFGVPCIVTENVGAKDLLKDKGIVTKDIRKSILGVWEDKNILQKLNANIVSGNFELDFEEHCDKIMTYYDEFLN